MPRLRVPAGGPAENSRSRVFVFFDRPSSTVPWYVAPMPLDVNLSPSMTIREPAIVLAGALRPSVSSDVTFQPPWSLSRSPAIPNRDYSTVLARAVIDRLARRSGERGVDPSLDLVPHFRSQRSVYFRRRERR